MRTRCRSIPVRKFWLRTAIFLTLLALCGPANNSYAAQYIVQTRYTTLTFNSVNDMESFSDSIKFANDSSLSSLFSSPSTQDKKRDLIRKIDLLFQKVQAILDMRKQMQPVNVRVYSNEEQMGKTFYSLYGQKCTVRGWYFYELNTVFLNVADVHEGMLAHELGHAIIDHFLSVRPPRATAEILARYVDENLFEEVKKY